MSVWFDWAAEAACRGSVMSGAANNADFFPDDDEPAGGDKAVLDFCERCPVRDECLRTALQNRYVGVWGGERLDPRRITQLRRLHGISGYAEVPRIGLFLGVAG